MQVQLHSQISPAFNLDQPTAANQLQGSSWHIAVHSFKRGVAINSHIEKETPWLSEQQWMHHMLPCMHHDRQVHSSAIGR
jgi:hypothetical protein